MTDPLLNAASDYYELFSEVSGADAEAWARARAFGDEVLPEINDYWQRAEYPLDLVRRAGELDLFTDGLDVPGHAKLSPLGAGLVNMELSRIDGSISTALAVQGGLALRCVVLYGSDEQRERWTEPLATGEVLGAFALTEPDHGSDSVSLATTAVRDGDSWILNGEKRWIGNGASGGITVVWARRSDTGEVGGFIVQQDTPGYEAEVIEDKAAMRAIHQAAITFRDVRVPDSARLPGATSFKDTAAVLSATRVGVAWSALGHALACYQEALEHAKTRVQFGRPLAKSQIIQQRLANMSMQITTMQLHCRRLAELESAGKLDATQASMAKVNNTRLARAIAADARDMLGGNGILLTRDVIRHMVDIEAIHTYEGTDTMQSLIVGRQLTGMGAFV
ncbi:acyl-CoA dehydrogenase family protein [Gulosibacter molinativorax]|uniref:Acyl-CoA dehydrogenase n=1 Tax=Gulosibacter molinativorax TaxID=256821 RepID=A0ABT7C8U9_9MICO|nr:acyl-CoA dehydrogenase family protein [Gulosibacter molinativorax]MDJ1371628.1 acyl-CoA dehydrogenase [Gulosibacter molinativorax]QUY61028.1 Acyl-CoA dehydrogenase [Gulosibacter molinativorax]